MNRVKIFSSVGFVALVAFAASASELDIARQALRDGLWEIARTHARQSTDPAAKLLVLESFAEENRWDAVADELARIGNAQGAAYDYYRAVVAGDYEKAVQLLRAGGAGVGEVTMHEADLLARAGKSEEARKLWQDVVAATNASPRAFAVAAMNVMDPKALRYAYERERDVAFRRRIGLRLGLALLKDQTTREEGAKLIRALVKDSPDASGAREAFLQLAEDALARSDWVQAASIFAEALEIWPEVAKDFSVQEGRGWASLRQNRREEALEFFARAESLAKTDADRARMLLAQGDVLADLGRGEAAMEKYRLVSNRYSQTDVAARLKKVIASREAEAKGRDLFKSYRFDEARKIFAEVALQDPSRKPRMDFFTVLCLYGEGSDDAAGQLAARLVESCPDKFVRAEAMLWLAKFDFNRRDWGRAAQLFSDFAAQSPDSPSAPEALLWSARACFAEGDFKQVIQRINVLNETYPKSAARPAGLLVQSEALIELARFDEAVLVLERVAGAEGASSVDRMQAQMLRADAFSAMGADNASRYVAALEAYRSILFGGSLDANARLVVSFKIGRVLEKLKRLDEALDQYYTQVVLAYREGRNRHERYSEEAQAAFSRAAFRLADEYEARGKDTQAIAVLEHIAESDVPAAEEASRRMEKLMRKGRFL